MNGDRFYFNFPRVKLNVRPNKNKGRNKDLPKKHMMRLGEATRDNHPAVVGGRMKTGHAIRLETEPGKGGAGDIANKA